MTRTLLSLSLSATLGCSATVAEPSPAGPELADVERTAPDTVELAMGELELSERVRALPTFTWDEYAAFALRFGDIAPWIQDPSALPEDARFGFNVSIFGVNRSFAVRSGPEGATLWLDLDADGRLDDYEATPVTETFTPIEVAQLEAGLPPIPIAARWSSEDGEGRLGLRIEHVREAELALAEQVYAVRLVGAAGKFAAQGEAIFDLDGDGAFDDDPLHDELFRLGDPEAYVSIGGDHWRLSTDPNGDRLVLRRRDDVSGPRPSMSLGQPAPDFEFGDEDRTRLSQLRGRPVLLEFFSPGCTFCAEAAPELRAAFDSLEDAGIEVISIDHNGAGEDARAFALEHEKIWRLALGADGDVARSLYRVDGVPTYVVIAADGAMTARGNWLALGEGIRSGALFAEP